MRLFHLPISLDAPLQPGEVVYTPLELSRLRRSAINFQRIVIASLVFFLLASATFVVASVIADANHTHDQCVSANHGRAAIKDAFAGLYDGFVNASHGAQAAVDFKNQQMRDIDKRLPQRDC